MKKVHLRELISSQEKTVVLALKVRQAQKASQDRVGQRACQEIAESRVCLATLEMLGTKVLLDSRCVLRRLLSFQTPKSRRVNPVTMVIQACRVDQACMDQMAAIARARHATTCLATKTTIRLSHHLLPTVVDIQASHHRSSNRT